MRVQDRMTLALGLLGVGLTAVAWGFKNAPVWPGYIGVIIVVVAFLTLALPPMLHKLPWEVHRRQPEFYSEIVRALRLKNLRAELQGHFGVLQQMDTPTAPELRAWAHGVATSLSEFGHAEMAERMEVNLPDNAERGSVDARKSVLMQEMVRALIWDNFS